MRGPCCIYDIIYFKIKGIIITKLRSIYWKDTIYIEQLEIKWSGWLFLVFHISQLTRHSRACCSYHDVDGRELLLTMKPLNQGFTLVRLKSSPWNCCGRQGVGEGMRGPCCIYDIIYIKIKGIIITELRSIYWKDTIYIEQLKLNDRAGF
jgi:hypothetical protein